MHTKQLVAPTFNVKKKDDRTVVGYCSVYGNVDSAGDIVMPGAFRDTIANFKAGRHRVKFLWNHDFSTPPTAQILNIREVRKSEMPSQFRDMVDVTGALEVTRKYFGDPFSDGVYQRIQSGVVTEMSFGYNVLESEDDTYMGKRVRRLRRLDMMDASDVNWGANSATVARVKNAMSCFVGRCLSSPQLAQRSLADMKRDFSGLEVFQLGLRLDEAQNTLAKRKEWAALKQKHLSLRADLSIMQWRAEKTDPALALELRYIQTMANARRRGYLSSGRGR